MNKSQQETPFTLEGRQLYVELTKKKPPLLRMDEFLNPHLTKLLANNLIGQGTNLYNFEYCLNRAYAFNRDKGKCRVCREDIGFPWDVHIHHIRPYLPHDQINRVQNLATVHVNCHQMIHDQGDYSELNKRIWSKILDFREKLKSPTFMIN